MTGSEMTWSLKRLYQRYIDDEKAGRGPPNTTITWNDHWVSVIKTLKEDRFREQRSLIDFIVSERRRQGLPDL